MMVDLLVLLMEFLGVVVVSDWVCDVLSCVYWYWVNLWGWLVVVVEVLLWVVWVFLVFDGGFVWLYDVGVFILGKLVFSDLVFVGVFWVG